MAASRARLSFMDGVWGGAVSAVMPSGEKHELVQTERVGPFLDGAVKVIEGRGYEADGTWHEVGDRIIPGQDPIRFFEMTLTRVGDSDWPAAGAIEMR